MNEKGSARLSDDSSSRAKLGLNLSKSSICITSFTLIMYMYNVTLQFVYFFSFNLGRRGLTGRSIVS